MQSSSPEIIPGIFEKEFSRIQERAKLVSDYVDWIHIDIADNKLVPNSSFLDPEPFKKLFAETGLKGELHMMVEDPFSHIDAWRDAGFSRFLVHAEGVDDLATINDQLVRSKQHDVGVCLAIDKQTSADVIFPFLDMIDGVLVMTIAAGFSGQSFIPELLDKVTVLRGKKSDLPIEVDGGITAETATLAVAAGATRLVSTSYIYNSDNIEKAINKLKDSSVRTK